MKVRIGILNCENGKERVAKEIEKQLFEGNEVFLERAMAAGEKISRWFNRQDTFFSGKKIWEYWELAGILSKFEAVVRGSSLGNVAYQNIAVFGKEGFGVEYEFFMERTKK